jgi:hypothetical protein
MALALAEDDVNEAEIQGSKISHLIEDWQAKHDTPFISFEYYVPRTEQGKRIKISSIDMVNG